MKLQYYTMKLLKNDKKWKNLKKNKFAQYSFLNKT